MFLTSPPMSLVAVALATWLRERRGASAESVAARVLGENTYYAVIVVAADGRADEVDARIGNHPCFVGPTQEHTESGVPLLHPRYRRAGRWQSADAPGTTPGGWRAPLGSFVHLPLAEFLSCFAGFTLQAAEELADGYEHPTITLAFTKP